MKFAMILILVLAVDSSNTTPQLCQNRRCLAF